METERERFLTAFVTTLIPCSAVTIVVLGLVGRFVGILWAGALYLVDLLIIMGLGRIAFKVYPGESTALIMEMSDYRIPHLQTIVKETAFRVWEFIKIAFPVIILGGVLIKVLEIFQILDVITAGLAPVTVGWLGLPALVGVTLIFGILRKELTLIMLATLFGTTDFALVLSPLQMIVFALVTMLYIPCVATIAAFTKQFGLKRALAITVIEVGFAVLLGGIAFRLFTAATLL